MRTRPLVPMLLLFAAAGCAHKQAAAPATPVAAASALPNPVLPPPPPPVKSIALRVDAAGMPKIGEKLNALLADARVPGATAHSQATVTLEDAQLSVECVEATAACFSAVGKSLGANRLLVGEVSKIGNKKKKAAGLKVSVTLFDVDAGAIIRTTDRSFKKEQDAVAAVKELVEHALGAVASSSTQPPPVAAPLPATASAAKTANPGSKSK